MKAYYWITYWEKGQRTWHPRGTIYYGNPFTFSALGKKQEKVWGEVGEENVISESSAMSDWRKLTEEELDLYEKAFGVKLPERKQNKKADDTGEAHLRELLELINRASGRRFVTVNKDMRAVYKSHGIEAMRLVAWSLMDKRSPVNWLGDLMKPHLVPSSIYRPTKFQAKLEKAQAAWLDVYREHYPNKRKK